MPLLNENDLVFLGWDVTGPFQSQLPSTEEIDNSITSEYFSIMPHDYAAMSFQNFSAATMKTVFRVAEIWGVQDFQIPGLEDFSIDLKRITRLPPAQMIIELTTQVVQETLDIVFNAIGAIPIVGWVIDIAWGVAQTIWTFVDMFRELDREPPGLAVEYTKDSDTTFTNRAIAYSSSDDWTDVFMPMRVPAGFESQSVQYAGSSAQAWFVGPTGGQILPNALAVMPGFPHVFSEFQIGKYIKPRKTPLPQDPDPRDVGEGPAANLGSFVPSLEQLGFSMWSMVRKNGANAFKVDIDKIESAWTSWFEVLVDYIEYKLGQSEPPDQHAQIANWLARFSSIGWIDSDTYYLEEDSGLRDNNAFRDYLLSNIDRSGFSIPGFQYWFDGEFDPDPEKRKNAPNSSIPGAYFPTWLPGIRFFIANYRKAMLDQFSRTLTVAYVGPDFPALKNSAIRKLWADHRKLLLSHSARENVELDLIPDATYRAAMAQAQRHPLWDITAPGPIVRDPWEIAITAAPYIPPEFPVPPPPGGGIGPGLPGASSRRWRISRAKAGMIALMAGGLAAWKGPELVRMAAGAIQRRR